MASFRSEELSAARSRLAFDKPYYAPALFAMVPVPVPGLGTFGVDARWRLYVDPGVLTKWTLEEMVAVLEHEVNHLLRDHSSRYDGITQDENEVSQRAWNFASDLEINDDLDASKLPGDPLLPSKYGLPDNLLAEEYLDKIKDMVNQFDKAGGQCDCGSGAGGSKRGWELGDGEAVDGQPGLTSAQAGLVRRLVASEVAAARSAGVGNVPAGLARWADALLNPKVDWRRHLAASIRSNIARSKAGSADHSWRRPSRRAPEPIILPGRVETTPRVGVVVDTSGSMSDDDLAQAWAEVRGIMSQVGVQPSDVVLYACDADAARVDVRGFGRVELSGGGGTDMGVGIRACFADSRRPNVAVVITDGHTPWPESIPPRTRVVVALIKNSYEPPPPPAWADVVRVGD